MRNTQGRPTTWTEEQVEQLMKMRLEGATVPQMAVAVGKTDGAVSGKLWQLRQQGRLNNEEPQKPPEKFEVCEELTEETPEMSPLEKEMAAIIEEQKSEIDHLNEMLADVESARSVLFDEKTDLQQKCNELLSNAQELRRELDDTKLALEENEKQFDEYRCTETGRSAIIKKLESDLEHTEAEISRLMREEERAKRIALGVVEKFALGVSAL